VGDLMAAPLYDKRRAVYRSLWNAMRVTRQPEAVTAARKLIAGKARYQVIEKSIGVPWYLVAILHMRESGAHFEGVLHNGEKIIGTGRKTKLVPAGRGPFNTWEDAAIDALKLKGYQKITDWCIERIAYCAESFNGWGYFWKGVPSAYLWSGSSVYKGGKYVADGVWDASAQDKQLGAMVVLRAMMDLDNTIRPGFAGSVPPAVKKAVGTIAAGGALATAAKGKGMSHSDALMSGAALIIAIAVVFLLARWITK
jgi:lysozyme family protein